jgi:hypothetical protein
MNMKNLLIKCWISSLIGIFFFQMNAYASTKYCDGAQLIIINNTNIKFDGLTNYNETYGPFCTDS